MEPNTNNRPVMQIARLRREKGVTQEEIAKHLGVTFQAVSKWETGAAYPDITLLPAIAAYFDTTIDTVMGYAASPANASAELYPIIKGALQGLPQDKVYRTVWNLSCLLHEAAATGGWSRTVPWEQRDRLSDNGYDQWGLSANLELDGYTLLAKGITVIGLMEQLALPSPSQCRRIAAFFNKLSQENVLKVLQYVVGKQCGQDDFKLYTLTELAAGAEISSENCLAVLEKLEDYGWLVSECEAEQRYSLVKRIDAVLLPLLAMTNAFLKWI